MKKYFIPSLAIVALMASCVKEASTIDDSSSNVVEIRATINNDGTKTDYDISNGTDGFFHWTGTETIGRIWYNSATTPSVGQDAFVSTEPASSGETSLIFSGEQNESQIDYALYPIGDGFNNNGISCSLDGSYLSLFLAETISYNPDAPLKDIVPMIGKIVDGEFVFTPATGVIAVTVKNLPSTATKITLSSGGDNALSGEYLITSSLFTEDVPTVSDAMAGITKGLTTDMAYSVGNRYGKKSITFSGLDRGTHIFYFPVSVTASNLGKYINFTISVYAGESLLQTVTNPNKITVEKGKIVRFPEMDLAKATKVKLTGSASAPYAYVEKFGPEATSVKFAVASTADAAITAAALADASHTFTATGEENKVEISDGLSISGKYYLGYVVYDSSNDALYQNSIPVYYLSDDDETPLTGSYSFSATSALFHYYRYAWIDIKGTDADNLIIQTSDTPSKGNVMITKIFGFSNDGSYSSYIVNHEEDGDGWPDGDGDKNVASDLTGTFGSGAPVYGVYNSGALTFTDAEQKPFMTYTGTHASTNKTWDLYVGTRTNSNQQYRNATFGFNFTTNGTTATLTLNPAAWMLIHFNGASHTNADNDILYVSSNSSGGALVATKAL